MAEISLKKYDLNYCKNFTEQKLRKIYNSETPEVLDALVEAVKGKKIVHKDIVETIEEVTEVKTEKPKGKK